MPQTWSRPTFLFVCLVFLPTISFSWTLCGILKLKPPCQPDSKHFLVHELCAMSISNPGLLLCSVASVRSESWWPHELHPTRPSVHGILQARRKCHLGTLLRTSQIQGSYRERESPRTRTCLGYLVFPDFYQWDHFSVEPENASPCLKVANKLDPERNLKTSEPEKFKTKQNMLTKASDPDAWMN